MICSFLWIEKLIYGTSKQKTNFKKKCFSLHLTLVFNVCDIAVKY
jgi:hypothetical protein